MINRVLFCPGPAPPVGGFRNSWNNSATCQGSLKQSPVPLVARGLCPGILVQCLQVCKCGVRPWFTSLCLRMDHSAARLASLVQTRWVRHLYWSYWHSHTHLCKYHLFLYAENRGPGSCQPGVSESHQVNWQGRERLNEQIHRRFLSSPLLLTKHRRIFCDFKT